MLQIQMNLRRLGRFKVCRADILRKNALPRRSEVSLDCISVNQDITATRPMPILIVLLYTRNPILVSAFDIKMIAANACAAKSFQRFAIGIDRCASFR